MAKKKIRKAPAIARSEIHLIGKEAITNVRESYRLIKTRILDIHDFIEITSKTGRKCLLNKTVVERVVPLI